MTDPRPRPTRPALARAGLDPAASLDLVRAPSPRTSTAAWTSRARDRAGRPAQRRRLRARAPRVVAGLGVAWPSSTSSCPASSVTSSPRTATGRARAGVLGPSVRGRGAAHRRADGAQPALPPVRRRHAHPRLGRRRRRHRRGRARHPQDDAGPAGAGEVRGALRRRGQPPDGPVRRGAGEGQPRGGRRGVAAAFEAVRPPSRTCPSRSSATPSSRSARCVAAGAELVLLDNMTTDELRECVAVCRAARRAPRGEAGCRSTRPRGRRNRRRLPGDRRADPLRTGAGPRARPAGANAAHRRRRQHQHRPRSVRRRPPVRELPDQAPTRGGRPTSSGCCSSACSSPTEPDGVAVCSAVPQRARRSCGDVRALLRRPAPPSSSARACKHRRARCSSTTRGRSGPTASSTPSPRAPCSAAPPRRRLRHRHQLRRRVGAKGAYLGGALAPGSRSRSTRSRPRGPAVQGRARRARGR